MFDAEAEPGGLMRTGIPSYRLPRQALDRDIDRIRALGVEFVPDSRIDHDRLDEMAHEFDAVLAATGVTLVSWWLVQRWGLHHLYELVPAFALALAATWAVSRLTRPVTDTVAIGICSFSAMAPTAWIRSSSPVKRPRNRRPD